MVHGKRRRNVHLLIVHLSLMAFYLEDSTVRTLNIFNFIINMNLAQVVILSGLCSSAMAATSITFYNGPDLTGANYSTSCETEKCTVIPLGYWPKSGSVEVGEPKFRRYWIFPVVIPS